jgi:phytoene synthase
VTRESSGGSGNGISSDRKERAGRRAPAAIETAARGARIEEPIAGPAAARDPVAFVREMTRRSRSNFYYAFLLLPRERREAIDAIYALSRAIDDAVDEAPSAEEGRRQLESWREEVALVATGSPRHPIAVAVARARARFPIPIEAIEALLEGARMDLEKDRYATFPELRLYCERVASAIGRMCIEVFGYRSSTARQYATDLGIALQLTNILRDLGSDARRGRVYLPEEDLERFGVARADVMSGRRSGAMMALLAFEAGRAKEFYRSAQGALDPRDRRSLLAAEVMRRIYRSLLAAIERSRFDVFDRRVRLSRTRRALLALSVASRTALTAR